MDYRVVAQTDHLIATIGSRCGACRRPAPQHRPEPRHRPMVNIRDLIDDAQCYETVPTMRWPDGVSCPHRSSAAVTKDGRDDTQPHRRRYHCHACRRRFDDRTGPIFPGHHQPRRTGLTCRYLMGLNLSALQIAKELDMNKDD